MAILSTNTGFCLLRYFGISVDISDDGNYVIVGGYGYDDQRGRAYVYDVSTTGLAVPMGTFDGDSVDILFGYGVSIDGDGDRVAVTASYGTVDFSLYEGTAYIYEYDSLSLGWSQLGQTIVGTEDTNGFDQIAISDDGNVIAVSASSAYNNQGVRSGRVYFYEFDGGSWIPMDQDYQGQEHLEQFGQQIDMSKDAQYIAIGAPLKNVPTNNEGAVAVGALFPQNLYLSGNPTLTGSYYAISTIYAQSNIPTGNQVKFLARDSIFLQFPFVIEVGAVLEAVIFP